jgi:hypothetical protein
MGFELFGDALFWGLTLGFFGKVILGATVINVHAHIIKERKIDMDVLKEMKRERVFGIIAVLLITAGYTLELSYFNYLPF